MSIPVMFILNALAHYDVSKVLIGKRMIKSWNIAFGALAISAVNEAVVRKRFGEEYITSSFWVKKYVFFVHHVSLLVTCYAFYHL